jgi:hypothetical protein
MGMPCPGCGITRASIRLLSGDVVGAFQLHPFAPAVVMGMALVLAGAVLPGPARQRLVQTIERIDRGGVISAALLVALVAYWVVRLVLDVGG